MNLALTAKNFPHLDKPGWRHDRIQLTWVHTGSFHRTRFGRNGETWQHYAEIWHDERPPT